MTAFDLPALPLPRATQWAPQSAVARATSPFTYAQQEYAHQGQRWRNTLEYPPLTFVQAREWLAFFLKLNGNAGTVLVSPYPFVGLAGAGGGTPVVDGASASGQVLPVRGLPADTAAVWKAGDFIGLGSGATSAFYCVLDDVDADGAGEASVSIWPRLRATPADGAAIETANPKCAMALADGIPALDVDVIRAGFSLSVVERIS